MLCQLYIENLAVIEKASIDFSEGMTVFTGETGAGKSIVIDALNACLGQRTGREIVRSGAKKAVVIASFSHIPGKVREILRENGYGEEEDLLVVQREISADGGSTVRLGGRPATVSLLREIGQYLINIHGQHDNQQLLSAERHLAIIDAFGGLEAQAEGYRAEFAVLREDLRAMKALSVGEEEKKRRVELLNYEISEIEKAKLSPRLEEMLEEKARKLRDSEKIAEALGDADRALSGTEEMPGACDLLTDAAGALDKLRDFPDFAPRAEAVENLRLELTEIASGLSASFQSLEYDQGEAEAIERRLRQVARLKSRYGGSVEEILSRYEKDKEELNAIASQKENLRAAARKAKAQKEKVSALANDLTEARIDAAVRLAHTIEEEARSLEMPSLRVETSFAPCKLSSIGNHSAEILISANLGEPPRPIAKIASGGELSRIMLAIKSALADKDNLDTLIFDEIDTGVSGKAAQKIGLKLQKIGSHRQVICVTHSAQIAALADHQLLIRKSTSGGRTFTEVLPLEGEARAAEVARIFSTDRVTDLMLQTARSMLEEGKRKPGQGA